jgi:DNA-binding beta-propeller fold protein YncE
MSYPKVVNTIATGTNPYGISSYGSQVWFSNTGYIGGTIDNPVTRIDVPTSTIDETVSIPAGTTGTAPIWFDGTNVFVGYFSDTNVYKINNATSNVSAPIQVGSGPCGISSDGTYAWVANQIDSTVTKINIIDNSIANTISLQTNSNPVAISSDATYTWVANSGDNTVNQIRNSDSVVLSTISLPSVSNPVGISTDGTYVWVANANDYSTGTLSQITISNPSTVITTNPLLSGFVPNAISTDNNYVWIVGNQSFSQPVVLQYDKSLNILSTIVVGQNPTGITAYGNYVWVANQGNDGLNDGSISQIQISNNPCFKIDTKILTDQGYTLIQDLKKGDLIKTINHGFVPIWMIGKGTIFNSGTEERIEDRLYQYTHNDYPEILEDLVLTGYHSILVPNFKEGQREKTKEILKKIYVTDDHYRLPACVDEKSQPYKEKGTFTIYHLALEHEDYYMNYGIYANGLLVESCSKRYLSECSYLQIQE